MNLRVFIPDRIELHGFTINAIKPYVLRNKKTKARYTPITYIDHQGCKSLVSLFNFASALYVSHVKYEVDKDIILKEIKLINEKSDHERLKDIVVKIIKDSKKYPDIDVYNLLSQNNEAYINFIDTVINNPNTLFEAVLGVYAILDIVRLLSIIDKKHVYEINSVKKILEIAKIDDIQINRLYIINKRFYQVFVGNIEPSFLIFDADYWFNKTSYIFGTIDDYFSDNDVWFSPQTNYAFVVYNYDKTTIAYFIEKLESIYVTFTLAKTNNQHSSVLYAIEYILDLLKIAYKNSDTDKVRVIQLFRLYETFRTKKDNSSLDYILNLPFPIILYLLLQNGDNLQYTLENTSTSLSESLSNVKLQYMYVNLLLNYYMKYLLEHFDADEKHTKLKVIKNNNDLEILFRYLLSIQTRNVVIYDSTRKLEKRLKENNIIDTLQYLYDVANKEEFVILAKAFTEEEFKYMGDADFKIEAYEHFGDIYIRSLDTRFLAIDFSFDNFRLDDEVIYKEKIQLADFTTYIEGPYRTLISDLDTHIQMYVLLGRIKTR